MHVLRQHDRGVDLERIKQSRPDECCSQGGDLAHEKVAAPIGQRQGEKVRLSGHAMAAVFGRASGVGVVDQDNDCRIDEVGCGSAPHPTPGEQVRFQAQRVLAWMTAGGATLPASGYGRPWVDYGDACSLERCDIARRDRKAPRRSNRRDVGIGHVGGLACEFCL